MVRGTHRDASTLGNIVTAILVCLAIGCRAKSEPSTASAESLASSLEELKQEVKQQTAVLHRALGKQIPVEMPAELQAELQSLQEALASNADRPPSGETAKELHRRVVELLHRIPPWAEEDVLLRLNTIRWSAELLAMAPIADNLANDALEEVESRLDTLAQSMPDNVPAHLREYLAKQQQLVQDSLRRERRKKAVQTATAALQGRGDAQQAWTGLEGIAGDAEVDRLRRELRLKTVADTARQRLVVIRSTLDKAKTCDDDELRRIAVTRAYDAAAGVLLDLMIEVPSSTTTIAEARSVVATCREEITKAANRQRAVTEKRLREYQAWALKQIRAFDGPEGWQYDITLAWVGKQLLDFKSAEKPVDWPLLQKFPSVRPLLEKTLELDLSDVKGSLLAAEKQKEIYNAAYARIGWKGNIDQEIAYRTTRDGIVTFLLPINPALLDPPVAQLYQKAFTKAWEKLDSRSADQLYVAEQTAVVPKRGIE